jgi:hypothetical protein
MNIAEATKRSLDILRSGENFQWYVIPFIAFAIYVYHHEIQKKNWNAVAAGLSLYMVHWLAEIINALIQHFSGNALWTVPQGTAFLLLVGVGIELSIMFSVTGIIVSMILPEDPHKKILGINCRLFYAIAFAALYSFIEIFLSKTPAFVWVYKWWGAIPVFITVYIPFFLAATYSYYWKPQTQKRFILSIAIINMLSLCIFGGILGWI